MLLQVEEGDSLPEVCNFANSFDMDKIVEFDASVAGRNRHVGLISFAALPRPSSKVSKETL